MKPPDKLARWAWDRPWAFRVCYTLSTIKDAVLALFDAGAVRACRERAGLVLGFQRWDSALVPDIADDPEFTPLLRAMTREQLQDLVRAFQTCQRHDFVHPSMWEHFARVLIEIERREGDYEPGDPVVQYLADPVKR